MAPDELQAPAQQWIEAITGEAFDGSMSFAENLKSGVRLCKLINTIRPGSVKKVSPSALAFKQIDNINMFLKGCQAMGMPASDCFGAKDLYEGESVAKVLSTLDGLGGLCQAQGVDVPTFGKNKYAKKNTRVWTEAQKLKQKQEDTGTMLMQGSAGTMERHTQSAGGITFGNAAVGAGSSDGGTLLSAGSAGTMERVEGSMRGITFGNDAAGAGSSGDGTLLNAGSAGTMERVQGAKAGITFGNQAAGAGSSGDGTLLNAGSAGTMQRLEVSKGSNMHGTVSGAGSGGDGTLLNSGSASVMERQTGPAAGITFGNQAAGAGSSEATLLNAGSKDVMERNSITDAGITFGANTPPPPPVAS